MEATQLSLWGAAFWVALWQHRRDGGTCEGRFALALLLGAGAAHAGWPWLVGVAPQRPLAPEAGFSVLFLPLGPLLLAREPVVFPALCPALALARLGCVAAGCCGGRSGEPLAALEALAWALLRSRLRMLPLGLRAPAFLTAFGALRLAQSPWRPREPPGAALSPEGVAVAWCVLGTAWLAGVSLSGRRHPPA